MSIAKGKAMIEDQLTEARNITMYPLDWATATQVAKDNGLGSVSAGLRFIIRDWIRLKATNRKQPAPAPAGNGQE